MRVKFNIGDKTVINGRCPRWLADEIRHNRLRTITAVWYDAKMQCCFYKLGINRIGDVSWDIEAYAFRSYQLHQPIKRGIGRPREKRRYNHRIKCTVASPNQNLAQDTAF